MKALVKTARGDGHLELPYWPPGTLGPTAISVSAFERAGVAPGETVVVLGPGPIGLICAMIARSMGAGRVVVVGRSSSRARLDVGERVGLEVWDTGEDAIEFPWNDALCRTLDVSFSFSSSYSLDRWQDAFRALERREVVKAVLTPS